MDINLTNSINSPSFIDNFSKNHSENSATEQLKIIHKNIKQYMPFIERIAVVVYEEEHDLLKTLIYSDDNEERILQFYQSKLSGSESLSKIAYSGASRVVNDLGIFERNNKTHSRFIAERNYGASFTSPFYNEAKFAGLIFINSRDKNVFNETNCNALSSFIPLISQIVYNEINRLNILHGSVSAALNYDHETIRAMATNTQSHYAE